MKAVMEHLQTLCYPSPCGRLLLGSYKGRLCLCDWAAERPRAIVDRRLQRALHAGYVAHPSELLRAAARQLDEYFNGQRTVFDLPLLLVGTDFQKTVWQRLLSVPYGETVSYALLARSIGRPAAVRAVAAANGANALSLFVPCHRVVGSDGSPTGYAGGLEAKEYLLRLEKARLSMP